MPYELFWHLTPKKLEAFHKAYEIKQRNIDYQNHTLGIYMMQALKATVCNHTFWLGKNATPYEYPKMPLMATQEEKEQFEEIEKQKAVDKFFAEQNAMRVNFNRNKKNKGNA